MRFPKPVTGIREANFKLNHEERAANKPVIQSFPLVAKIEITSRCNLRCTMCSVSYRAPGDNGNHLDISLFLKLKPIFPTLVAAYLYGIGEPLLHPQSMEMFEILAAEGVNVGFISNGTLLTEDKVRAWLRGGLYKLSVSMDGATKEVYEKIRRWGDFEKLVRNLEMVSRLKQEAKSLFPILTLNFVAMKDNIHDLVLLVELAHRFKAREVIINELIPFTNEMKEQELTYDNPILHYYYSQAEKLARELGVNLMLPHTYLRWRAKNGVGQTESVEKILTVNNQTSGKFLAAENIIESFDRKMHEIPFASCTEPWSGFWFSQKGEVDPCCYWFKSMGNVRQHEFGEIWNNANYQHLRTTINNPETRHEQCRKCPVPS